MGISLSHTDQIVSITSPTTQVTIQELVSAIREWEDELENMTIPFVIWTGGKTDLGGSKFTAITMTLNDEWQIQFWSGVSQGFVGDGNLVGGVGGIPIKPTGGNDTIVVNNQVGGVLIVSGSGVTEQDKTDIADAVWEHVVAAQLIGLNRKNTKYEVLTKNGSEQTLTANLITYTDETLITPVNTYLITITYNGSVVATHTMVWVS